VPAVKAAKVEPNAIPEIVEFGYDSFKMKKIK
jgi:hypothetical protein